MKLIPAYYKTGIELLLDYSFFVCTSTCLFIETLLKQTSPDSSGDVELMGTFFIWFFSPNIFLPLHQWRGPG